MNSTWQRFKTLWDYRFRYFDLALGFAVRNRSKDSMGSMTVPDVIPAGFDGLARLHGSIDMLHSRFETKETFPGDGSFRLAGWLYVDVDCKPLGVSAHIYDFSMQIELSTGIVVCDTPQLSFHSFSGRYEIPQLCGRISRDWDRLELRGEAKEHDIKYEIKARSYNDRSA